MGGSSNQRRRWRTAPRAPESGAPSPVSPTGGGGRRRTSLAPDFGPLPKETLRRPGVTHTHTQNTCAKTSGTNALQAAGLIPVAFVSVWGGGGRGMACVRARQGGPPVPSRNGGQKSGPEIRAKWGANHRQPLAEFGQEKKAAGSNLAQIRWIWANFNRQGPKLN